MAEGVLCYDIETYVPGGRPNPEKDELRIFGCYSYITNKKYLLTNREDIQQTINSHKYLVGFNVKDYDNPILIRMGIKLDYKYIIDMKKIFEERADVMKIKEGLLGNLLMHYSLDYISRTIGIVNDADAKIKIDYKMFSKPIWTADELKEIKIYTDRDIDVHKKMYDWLEEYFAVFKEYLPPEDVKGKKYLTDTVATYTYKVICKELGIKPEFEQGKDHEKYGGGYVAYPAGERFEGPIAMFDFSSLYPNVFRGWNLFNHNCTCCTNEEKWHGDNVFKVNGFYCKKTQGKIEKLMEKFLILKDKYTKEHNSLAYTVKIVLNTSYGVCGNPSFKHMYDRTAASDCTWLGRQCIKYVRKRFRENGYINLLSDTDSCAVKIPQDKTMEDTIKLANQFCDEIKQHMLFPWNLFSFKLEDEIKYFFFFKGKQNNKEDDIELDEDCIINKPKNLMKKNYIYISHDNKLVIKNLGIKKKSNSLLSRKIFNDYLIPQIIEKGEVKFSKAYLQNLIIKLLEEDITLAAMRHDVGSYDEYKDSSPTGLHAQIALKHGAGIHMLIPNTKNVGVGKGKSYATLLEFTEHNLTIGDIDLDNVWNELGYFLKPVVVKNIFAY